ncbi:MAG: hypothetical protein AAB393_13075, partial [Bacteroidota bacterium]
SNHWTSLGPAGGVSPFGFNGRISGVSIVSSGGNSFIYVGGSSGGLWKSSLSAPGWISLGDGLPNQSVRGFAVNPSNLNEIIVGTGDFQRFPGAGMYRTSNGGSSWSFVPLPIGVTPSAFYRVIYLPGNTSVVLAASDGGVLRSTNGGSNWTVTLSGHATDLGIDPSNPLIQYTCVASIANPGVYKSTDAGVTWAWKPALVGIWGRASLAICRDAPNNIAVMVEGNNTLQAVIRSSNGGDTWTVITSNIRSLHGFDGGQIFHAQAIAFRPTNPNAIFVGGVKVAFSVDGGQNWLQMGDEVHKHDDVTQLYFSDITGTTVLWICNDGGIFRYPLGGTTENWNGLGTTGLRCSQVDYMDAQRTMVVMGLQDDGILRSTASGSDWETISVSDGFDCEITDDLTLEFWYSDGIYSGPAAQVFKQPLTGPPQATNNFDNQVGLFFDRFVNRVYSTGPRINSSPRASPSWSTDANLTSGYGGGRIFGSPLVGRTLYVAGGPNAGIAICRYNGSWDTSYYSFSFTPGEGVETIFTSTDNEGEAWVGLKRAVTGMPMLFQTLDYGMSWQNRTGTLSGLKSIRAIITKPLNPREVYVGTDIGVFRSLDGGVTWSPFQDGLPIVSCTDLRYIIDPAHSGNDKLIVATYGRGLYERTITTSPIVYTDQTASGFEDGTFEHPYNTMGEGITIVPTNGMLGLRGGQTFTVTVSLSRPMTIKSYGGVATINR